ncbi:MaoC family dehydratase [Candidatus Poriferisodalis sp.]|uniref:MaoC family dehydratase n=1 Tax=Candidatus Poriferisodalis sp. TaxID=3101277 RepID=UPI003B52D9C2
MNAQRTSDLELTPTTAPAVTPEAMRSFVDGVSDPNPVHTDPEFAAKAGLPDVVVQASHTSAIALDALIAQFGADAVLNLDIRLRGPIFPGDEVTVSPVSFGELDRGVELRNQRGDVIATGIVVMRGDPDE